jgi:hypothetical protein
MAHQEVKCGVWTGLGWLRIEVAGTCECGNKPSGSIKCGNFLTSCKRVSFSRRTLLHVIIIIIIIIITIIIINPLAPEFSSKF